MKIDRHPPVSSNRRSLDYAFAKQAGSGFQLVDCEVSARQGLCRASWRLITSIVGQADASKNLRNGE
jgi:hypothetical protein